MKITRRGLAGIAAAAALAPSRKLEAQKPPAEESISAARAQFMAAGRVLAAVKVPRDIEPAARFEA